MLHHIQIMDDKQSDKRRRTGIEKDSVKEALNYKGMAKQTTRGIRIELKEHKIVQREEILQIKKSR